MKRRRFPDGIAIKPDGMNDLLPCVMGTRRFTECDRNRQPVPGIQPCRISWKRQADTEDEIIGEFRPVPDDE